LEVWQKMKSNRKALTITAVLALLVCGSAIYANKVYLPTKQDQQVQELLVEPDETPAENDLALKSTSDAQPEESKTTEDSNVTVTTDENGEVWISRNWLVDTSGYDLSDGPTEATDANGNAEDENTGAGANISAGQAADIVGEDGVYHGENVAETPAPTDTNEAVSNNTQSTAAAATTVSPSTTQSQSSGNSGTPQPGDTRVVNGVKQTWVTGWGWIYLSEGGTSEPSSGTSGYIGETCPNASFG
jgi:hypothetical protein